MKVEELEALLTGKEGLFEFKEAKERFSFDEQTRPQVSPAERDEVKKVARGLLAKLKAILVLDWRQKSQARAQVRLAIEDALDDGLPPPYTKDLYQRKVGDIFEHVYESYRGEGASVYSAAA